MTTSIDESQRKISALVRVGRAMVSAADYGQALGTLTEVVSRLLNAESGGFMLYDPERDELVLQEPAFGIDDAKAIAEYHVPIAAGGNAVRVFLSGRAYMTNDAANDARLIRRFVEMFSARKVLSIPLSVEDRPIGVFHAINKRDGDFGQADLDLLALLAPLLAVSVSSAQMFRELRDQRRQLERAVFLQAELSRTALDAPGMEPLAERLADLIARPVMVLDTTLRPLASARWPANQVPSQTWIRRSRLGDGGPVGDGPVVNPIVVGTHFGGYLAVLPGAESLDLLDTRAIDHAAGIFALEMFREQNAYEIESRLKGDLLQDLFTGSFRDEEEATGMLRRLGFTLSGPCRVARLEPAARTGETGEQPARWQEEMQGPQSRLYAALKDTCAGYLGLATVAPWRSGFLLLLPATGSDTDLEVAVELFSRCRTAGERIRPGLRLHMCLGATVASPAGLGQSLEESERALAVARTLEITDRPMLFEHLGVYRILVGPNSARDRRDFVDHALGALIRYDADHSADLVATLRSWLAADYSITDAAKRLFVHTNTLKYRLKRIRTLLGGDPSRGDLRLQIELALRMLDMSYLAGAVSAPDAEGQPPAEPSV